MAAFAKSTFSHASYAAFRPTYPPSLYQTVLKYHQGPKDLCVDLGSGHGLVAISFAKEFKKVIGTDPSPGMIKQAQAAVGSVGEVSNLEFREASAENLSFLEDGSVDLVTAGQAAHWFDYPKLWPEMKRVLRKGGTLAYWGYQDCVFVDYPEAGNVIAKYSYGREYFRPYWSEPGRSIVENKLRDVQPPESDWTDITRIEYTPGTKGPASGEGTLFLEKKMTLANVKNYIRTWSAYHGWQQDHPEKKKRSEGGAGDIVDEMFDEMAKEQQDWHDEKEVNVEWGSGLLLARKSR